MNGMVEIREKKLKERKNNRQKIYKKFKQLYLTTRTNNPKRNRNKKSQNRSKTFRGNTLQCSMLFHVSDIIVR